MIRYRGAWPLEAPLSWLPWALLLLPKLSGDHLGSFYLNGPAWTLSLELIVNFLYAFMLPWLSTRRVAVGAVTFSTMLAAMAVHWNTIDFHDGLWPFVSAIARVGAPFFIGLLLYRARSAGWLPAFRLPLELAVGLFLLTLPLPIYGVRSALAAWAVIVFVFPIVVMIGIACPISQEKRALFAALGKLSFPVYALHLPLLVVAGQIALRFGASSQQASTLMIAPVLLFSWLSIRFYDKPVNSRLRTLMVIRGRDATAAPAI